MKTSAIYIVAASLALLVTPAQAKSYWDQLSETSPRSVFDDVQDTAPRTIFDDIRESAPVRAPDADPAGFGGE